MSDIESIIKRTEDVLATAKFGFDDLAGSDRARRFTGLRNLIVFGRSVTFVLQNLRSAMPPEEFDTWYAPKQEEMKEDAVLKHFVKLRNELEKQGHLPVGTAVHVKEFSFSDIEKYPKPPGTTGFFIGDNMGGSGFEVEMPDGTKQKYYVDLPTEKVEVTQHFTNLPEEIEGMTVEEASKHFLDKLDKLVSEARSYFIGTPTKKPLKNRAHLRVVK